MIHRFKTNITNWHGELCGFNDCFIWMGFQYRGGNWGRIQKSQELQMRECNMRKWERFYNESGCQ